MDEKQIKKAIETLKSLCRVIYGNRAHVTITAEQGLDFETAIACMELQAPKTIKILRDKPLQVYICPTCRYVAGWGDDDPVKRCEHCGQVLDHLHEESEADNDK